MRTFDLLIMALILVLLVPHISNNPAGSLINGVIHDINVTIERAVDDLNS